MRIKYLISMASAESAWGPGHEADVDDEEGARLVQAGYAVPVRRGKVERAVASDATREMAASVAGGGDAGQADGASATAEDGP